MLRQRAQVCTRCAPTADTWAHRCQGSAHRPYTGLHRYGPRAKRRSGHVPHLHENFISSKGVFLGKQMTRKGRPYSQRGWPSESKLNGGFGGLLVSCHVGGRVVLFCLSFSFEILSLFLPLPRLFFPSLPLTFLPTLFLQVPCVHTVASRSVVLWDC